MIERPSQKWLREAAEQEAAVAAGALSQEEAYALELWPPQFAAEVDGALAKFAREADGLDTATDDAIWTAIEHVVGALNAIDDSWECIETGEREELCQFIDDVLTAAGVDVVALTARRDLGRDDLTDQWREW